MKPTFYMPVGGTRAWNDRGSPKRRWWQSESDFCLYLHSLNVIMLDPHQPFVWTTDLGGIQFWRRWPIWFGKIAKFRDHRDWIAGGENFLRYCESPRGSIPFFDRNIISHSHGLQVVAYACNLGLKINNLVSIAPPYRHDMVDIMRGARPNIKYWAVVHDKDDDSIATAGGFGDGKIWSGRVFRDENARPDVEIALKNIGHSGLFTKNMGLWKDENLVDILRQ